MPCSTDGFGRGDVATVEVVSGGGAAGDIAAFGSGLPGGAAGALTTAMAPGDETTGVVVVVGADTAVGLAGAAPCITPAAGGLTA